MGWSLSVAWKLVPKSTANALPFTSPSWSTTNFAVRPAENRSEKFCAKVAPAKVWLTEYTAPVPSGWSTVYTG